jgi:hypothetical protein
MIHHISIAAIAPLHVAEVLSEFWNGKVAPFPSHPGSYIVLALDEHGTMIEVYPMGTEMTPGQGQSEVEFVNNAFASPFTATHAALSVPVSQEEIERIAAREGWRAVRCDRGPFEVIEVWIENQLLLELLPPAIASKYLDFMQPQNLEKFFAAQVALA